MRTLTTSARGLALSAALLAGHQTQTASANEPAAPAADAPFIRTNGRFELQLLGQLQFDLRQFLEGHQGGDGFLLRRVRPGLRFRAGDTLSGRITPEFAGDTASVVDAYIDVALLAGAQLRLGKFKAPVGYERLISSAAMPFVERAYPTELAPNRELGIELRGDAFDRRLGYELALGNGTPDGRDSDPTNADGHLDTSLRLLFRPFDGAGVGLAGSTGHHDGSGNAALPRYRSPGQVTIFQYGTGTAADGRHTRLSPQAWLYRGPLGLSAERIDSIAELSAGGSRSRLHHRAWAFSASWVLSGEPAGVASERIPQHPVGRGGTGAWEVLARYTGVSFDDASFQGYADPAEAVRGARSTVLGLNWSPTATLKLALNLSHTDFRGGAGSATDRPDEDLLFARVQLSF